MNIRQSIGQFMVKLGQSIWARPLSLTSLFGISTQEVYPHLSSEKAVSEGFNANTPIYAVAMMDAEKFGSIPRYVYDTATMEEKAVNSKAVIGNSKLSALINRPNPYESQDAFFTKERAYFKVCGESFVWLNRGDLEGFRNPDGTFDDKRIDRMEVLEMYVLPSQFVTIIPDPSNVWGVIGYILETGADRLVLRYGDVIHWKSTNLTFNATSREHLRGMSALVPGSITAEEARSLAKTSLRRSQNDGAKGVLFNETMASMTPQQQTDLKRIIDTKINNNLVAEAVAVLNGKYGYQNLAIDNRANQTVELKKMSWQEICMLMKVPYELFDPSTTFSNKEMAQVSWVTNSIIPATKQHDGEYNRVLPKAFGLEGKAFIGSDCDDLPEVRQSKMNTAKAMLDIWPITPNEVREYIGYDKIEDDSFNVPWVPTGRTPMSEVQSPADELAQELEMQRLYEQRANQSGSTQEVSGNSKGA